jgi:hypothetical protein
MRKHWIGIIKWNDGTILKTEPFYDYDEGIKAWSSKFSYENKGKFEWIDYEKIEEPKQETLEEAAENFIPKSNKWTIKDIFIEGAKWQQERSYSEEDMKRSWQEATEDMRKQFSTSYSGMTFEKFIEHYKKQIR